MEKQELTVGFADIEDFLRIQREHGADAMVAALDDFYRQVGDRIFDHGGRIVKYIGDAILFTFRDPQAAVRAARAITTITISSCPICVSLATGEVYVGLVGHPRLQRDDVLGPAVNAAGLLLQEAKQRSDRIAMTRETRARVTAD